MFRLACLFDTLICALLPTAASRRPRFAFKLPAGCCHYMLLHVYGRFLSVEMESQCQMSMYFPAAPIMTLSDPSQYASLPRRKHAYHGETVQFLLVLRSRNAAERRDGSGGGLPWRDVMGSLSALASVCVAESRKQGPGEDQQDLHSSHSEDGEEEEPGEWESGTSDTGRERADGGRGFRRCSPLHTHSKSASDGQQCAREPVRVRRQ